MVVMKYARFALVGVLLLAPVCLLSRRGRQRSLESPAFRFAGGVTVLVTGDSHPEGAIDPKWLPRAENIAHSGDNYFYSHEKLNFFLARNPQVRTVVLGFSWHNLPRGYQESFLFGDANDKIGAYYPILDAEGRDLVRSWNASYRVPWGTYTLGLPLRVYNDPAFLRRVLGRRLDRDDFDFFGAYRDSSVSHVDGDLIARKAAKYFTEAGATSPASPLMAAYLMRILDACEARGIKVVLVNTPVHPLYRARVPEASVRAFDDLLREVGARHPSVTYLDYSGLKLDPGCYYDGDHVNRKGAEAVTRLLAAEPSIR